jgi:hypothetical protein
MISLQFLADGIQGYMLVGSTSWILGTLLIALPFLGGILFFYIVKVYFIGNKTAGVNQIGAGYAPQASYPSQQQKDTETVIS